MNFLLTICTPESVVLFGSRLGLSGSSRISPSFPTSFRNWIVPAPLSPRGTDDFGAISFVGLFKSQGQPSRRDAGSLLGDLVEVVGENALGFE